MVWMRMAVGLAAVWFLTSRSPGVRAQQADLILHGGTILTLDEKQPSAGAVAVRDGKITAVDSLEDLASQKGPATRIIDLGGKTLVPGFIDSHGHLINVGLQRSVANLLPPPDGQGRDIGALRELLTAWASSDAA
jgi:predicted amidohydrolase YtcJ